VSSFGSDIVPPTPPQPPANAYSHPSTLESAATMDSLEGSRASVSCILMGSPSESPWLLRQSHISCCSSQMLCVSGTSDLVCDDKVPIPCCIPFLADALLYGEYRFASSSSSCSHAPPLSLSISFSHMSSRDVTPISVAWHKGNEKMV
jgi:hypothetical protein